MSNSKKEKAAELLGGLLGEMPDDENWMAQSVIIHEMLGELRNRSLMCSLMGIESQLKGLPEVKGVSFSGNYEMDDQGGSYFNLGVQLRAQVNEDGKADCNGEEESDWEDPGDLGLAELGDGLESAFTNQQREELDGFEVEFETAKEFTKAVGKRLLQEDVVEKWLSTVEARQIERHVPCPPKKRLGPKGL
jgi:hypothetical protein